MNVLRVATLVLVLGCAQEATAPTSFGPISLLIVSGNSQSGAVGTELPRPLVIKATRPNGTVIPGLTVVFRVTSGGGSMFAGAASTDARGLAADYWTLGTSTTLSESVEVRAVLPNGTKEVFGRFGATALAGRPVLIAPVDSTIQTGTPNTPVAFPPSVIVRDTFSNPVPGVTVTFAPVLPGGGSVTGGTQSTDAAGIATVGSWTFGPTCGGIDSLTATAAGSGIFGNPVLFTAMCSGLVFTAQPSNAAAGGVIAPPVRVCAVDFFGNVMTSFAGSVTVAIASNPAAGLLLGTTTQATVNGCATYPDLSINNAGSGYTLSAATSGLTSATSAPFNIGP